jgi:hypothetical protein
MDDWLKYDLSYSGIEDMIKETAELVLKTDGVEYEQLQQDYMSEVQEASELIPESNALHVPTPEDAIEFAKNLAHHRKQIEKQIAELALKMEGVEYKQIQQGYMSEVQEAREFISESDALHVPTHEDAIEFVKNLAHHRKQIGDMWARFLNSLPCDTKKSSCRSVIRTRYVFLRTCARSRRSRPRSRFSKVLRCSSLSGSSGDSGGSDSGDPDPPPNQRVIGPHFLCKIVTDQRDRKPSPWFPPGCCWMGRCAA